MSWEGEFRRIVEQGKNRSLREKLGEYRESIFSAAGVGEIFVDESDSERFFDC